MKIELDLSNHLGAYQDWESTQYRQSSETEEGPRYHPMWLLLNEKLATKQKINALKALSSIPDLELQFNFSEKVREQKQAETKENVIEKSVFIDNVEKTILENFGQKLINQNFPSDSPKFSILIYVSSKIISSKREDLLTEYPLCILSPFFEVELVGPPVSVPNFTENFVTPDVLSIDKISYSLPIGAIIDDGVGYLNSRFYRSDGSSRFKKVWLQSNPVKNGFVTDSTYEAGSEVEIFPTRDIGKEINERRTYRQHRDNNKNQPISGALATDRPNSHGTHVADLAFGQDPRAGVSENSSPMLDVDLLAVELPRESVLATHGKYLDTHVLQGIRWVVKEAITIVYNEREKGWRPLVVNISFGSHAGHKDGSDFLAKKINQTLAIYSYLASQSDNASDKFARAVLAYGNHGGEPLTALVKANEKNSPDDNCTVSWRLLPDDHSFSYLEMRADSKIFPTFDLITSFGKVTICNLTKGTKKSIKIDGETVAAVYAEHVSIGKSLIVIAVVPTRSHYSNQVVVPAGLWTVKLLGSEASVQVARDDTPSGFAPFARQSYLEHPASNHYDPIHGRYNLPFHPLLDSGNQSSWTDSLENHTESIGASLERRGKSLEPWRLASKGSAEPLLGGNKHPTGSAVGSQSRTHNGILASGTLSGSSSRLSGSSMATAQRTKAILFEFLSPKSGTEYPKTSPHNQRKHRSQLGKHHTSTAKRSDGFYVD